MNRFRQEILRLKQFIANSLVAAAGIEPLRQLLDFLLWRIMKKRLLPIIAQSEAGQLIKAELAPSILSESTPPRVNGSLKQTVTSTFPPIQARQYAKAMINSRGCGIVVNNQIAVPDYYYNHTDRYLFSADNIPAHNSSFALANLENPNTIPQGILVAGLGSFNWYHWLIEILPAAMLASKLPDEYQSFPLLVPEEYNKYSSFKDALQVFAGDRPVISLSHANTYHIETLIVIDSPVHGPLNLQPGIWPAASDYHQHAGVMLEYRQRILQHLGITVTQPKRCIFLARSNNRREYNQQMLVNIAQEFGLEVVYPETLTFAEQVQLFHCANVIVGASGAAWSGLLFAAPGTRCLSWLVPEHNGFCGFSNLAHIIGANMHYVFTPAATPLATTGDAYMAKYHITPEQFRRELEQLLA